MTRTSKTSKAAILDAVEVLLRRAGANGITMDAVAKEAGCAKGLLNYHFRSKRRLLVETLERMAAVRSEPWALAFDTADPREVVDRTWKVVRQEADSGFLRAWTSLASGSDAAIDQAVKNASIRFTAGISADTEKMLARAGLAPAVPAERLGWMLASIVYGMSFNISAGADLTLLGDSYAAAGLGILALAGLDG